MAKIFGYCARYLLNLCLMIAVIFMLACTVLVIVLVAKGDIKIRMIRGNAEKEIVDEK